MGKIRVLPDSDGGFSLNFPETCPSCYKNKRGTSEVDFIYIGHFANAFLIHNLCSVKVPVCQKCYTKHSRLLVIQWVFLSLAILAVASALILGIIFIEDTSKADKFIPIGGVMLGIGAWGLFATVYIRRFSSKTRLLDNKSGICFEITAQEYLDEFANMNKSELIGKRKEPWP